MLRFSGLLRPFSRVRTSYYGGVSSAASGNFTAATTGGAMFIRKESSSAGTVPPPHKYEPPFPNEPDDYRRLVETIERDRKNALESPTRFQHIREREDRSDIPQLVSFLKRGGKFLQRYKGLIILKSPEDFFIYHQLLSYVKPPTIIELGTNTGGMAVWFADTLKLLNVPGQIYSMDIDLSLVSPDVLKVKPDNVTYIEGDCFAIEKTFTPEFLSKLPHPWVIIDDAHVNMPNILKYFHQFTTVGDYFVVEDTDPTSVPRLGENKHDFNADKGIGPELLEQLKSFLTEHGDHYAVDSFLTDLYGYNGTWHWHGFVRRMK